MNVEGLTESEFDGPQTGPTVTSSLRLLRDFLKGATERGEHVSAMALQEHWMRDGDELDIEGYEWFGRNRTRLDPNAKRGSAGVGWLVSKRMLRNAKCDVTRPTYGGCEGLIVVKIKTGDNVVSLINAYTEHDRPGFGVNQKAFVTGVMKEFSRAKQKDNARRGPRKHVYIFSDLNIRVGELQEPESSRRTSEPGGGAGTSIFKRQDIERHLIKEIGDAGGNIVHGRLCSWRYTFAPLNPARGRSVVDYCIADKADLGRVYSCGICDRRAIDVMSSHRALFARVDLGGLGEGGSLAKSRRRRGGGCPYARRRLRDAPEEVNRLVASVLESRVEAGLLDRDDVDVDANFGAWKDAVLGALERAAPVTVARSSVWKPHFNAETAAIRTRRLRVLDQIHDARRVGEEFDGLRAEYNRLAKEQKRAARRARDEWCEKRNTLIRAAADDPDKSREMWNHILLRGLKKTEADIELLMPGRPGDPVRTTTVPGEVAAIFRENYAKIGADTPPPGHTFVESERRRQDRRVEEILRKPPCVGPAGGEIVPQELKTSIGRLKYGKATGFDFISTDSLKVCVDNDAMLRSLCFIMNQCLSEGVTPRDWTIARITAVFKKGDRRDWKNYRLISLLSVVGKLFESVLALRLEGVLKTKLSQCQHGFRKGYRCQDASSLLAWTIEEQKARKKSTYIAYLDVRKAYPTCRRAAMLERLFAKLTGGGDETRRPRVWTVIEKMLREENCRSKVVVDGVESDEYTVGHGLREGAVLSPLLYTVFIDDLPARLKEYAGVLVGGQRIRCLLYADDIALVAESAADLQKMLDACQAFADESSFQFSMDKSNVVVFGHRETGDGPSYFFLGNAEVKQVPSYTYLGLEMSRSLGFWRRGAASCEVLRDKRFYDEEFGGEERRGLRLPQ